MNPLQTQPLRPVPAPQCDVELVLLDATDAWRGQPPDRILFLDIDGVLHPEGRSRNGLLSQMGNFCVAVGKGDPNVECAIVISSTWRTAYDLQTLRSFFPLETAKRIIGVTPEFDEAPMELNVGYSKRLMGHGIRQYEIEHWMQAFAPRGQWLAIDDRACFFREDCVNLFLVPQDGHGAGGIGITIQVAQDLTKRIAGFVRAPGN